MKPKRETPRACRTYCTVRYRNHPDGKWRSRTFATSARAFDFAQWIAGECAVEVCVDIASVSTITRNAVGRDGRVTGRVVIA